MLKVNLPCRGTQVCSTYYICDRRGKSTCPNRDSNPGPLAYHASTCGVSPRSQKGHGKLFVKKYSTGALWQWHAFATRTYWCMFYSAVLLYPALLFFPSTFSLFSNPKHEVLPVTLIYKVFCRPTVLLLLYDCPVDWHVTSIFKQLVCEWIRV